MKENENIKFYVARRKNGRFYLAGNNIIMPVVSASKSKTKSSTKKSADYSIIAIDKYFEKYKDKVEFSTHVDSDMSDYVTNVKKAKRDHERNIARTFIVMNKETKDALGYFTLKVTCLKCNPGDFINGESNAYYGCNAMSNGYFPVIELLMIAKNDTHKFQIKMKDIFFKDIAKKIFKVYQEVGMVYLYLECSYDNKELREYYSTDLKFMPFPDYDGVLKSHNLAGYIQRIEFIIK